MSAQNERERLEAKGAVDRAWVDGRFTDQQRADAHAKIDAYHGPVDHNALTADFLHADALLANALRDLINAMPDEDDTEETMKPSTIKRNWRELSIAVMLAAVPTIASAGKLPPLNFNGNLWLGFTSTEGRVPSVQVKMVVGSHKPTDTNTFGATVYTNSFLYYELSCDQVVDLSGNLKAWAEAPTSDSIFSVSSGSFGFSAAGSATDPSLPPVVVLQILLWMDENGQHHHGGNYATLSQQEARELAAALYQWTTNPTPGAMIYEKSVQ